MTDAQLLEEYAARNSESAFAELVRRHADWVYSAARRMVRDPHLAEDVTQAVFLLLAQQAKRIGAKVSIGGWLFNVTRNSARHALRSQARRQKHEKQAAEMTLHETPEEKLWTDISIRLEELVAGLRQSDREAVLLRFYEKKSMAEVGAALGVSEDAAKKRVAAAVEKLRRAMGPSGGALSITALTAALATHTTQSCPAALVAACTKIAALAPAAPVASIAHGVLKMMLITKIKIAALAAVVIGVCVAGGVTYVAMNQSDSAAPTAPAVVQPVAASSANIGADQETARRAQCAHNLRMVGAAVQIYVQSNAGNLPSSLGALAFTNDPNIFLCPDSGAQPSQNWASLSDKQKSQWVIDHADYIYLLGSVPKLAAISRPSEMVMAYEPDTDHSDGMNVLFADGHVEWHPSADAHQLIDSTRQALNIEPAAPNPFFDRANREVCMANMRQIGLGLLMYAESHHGAYPPNLGALVKTGVITEPRIFLCPDSPRQLPADWNSMTGDQRAQWITEHSNYVYLAPKLTTKNMRQIGSVAGLAVLCESNDNHGTGVNIAFADGHVEFQNLDRGHVTIQASKAELAALH